jgi:predicted dehydrogenase
MIKAAFLGFGNIAQAHLKGYRELQAEGFPLQITAYYDICKERLEGIKDANTYSSVDDMLAKEKDLDYVDICVPTFLHAEMAVKCMEAGYHVLCEKPMALNEKETAAMIECRNRTKKQLMIAHCMRFFEPLKAIRKYIIDGTLGKPKSAFFIRPDGRPRNSWNNWFWDKNKSGGAILDLQIHDTDIINWYFGMPKWVSAAAAERHPGSGYETVIANHYYEGGLIVNSYTDWTVMHNKYLKRVVRINFEHGYIFHDRSANNLLVAVDEEGNETDLWGGLVVKDMYRNEIEYFASQLMQERGIRYCPPESSAEAVKIIMAQVRSAGSGGAPVALE